MMLFSRENTLFMELYFTKKCLHTGLFSAILKYFTYLYITTVFNLLFGITYVL